MATLVLQAAGAFAGNLIGGPFGAMVGQAAGAVAGSMIDQAIFGRGGGRSYGPRLTRMPGLSASEGSPVARVYGRARVGGALIWMTRFEEQSVTTRSGGAGGKSSSPKTTNYAYFGNFGIGICEGPIAEVRRIWADGEELDQTRFTIRIHPGSDDQSPDPLIVAKEGAGNATAYAGIAYAVFERMPLADFGNRIPQFSFEVVRTTGGLSEMVQAVCLIPGSTEFAYEPSTVIASQAAGVSTGENRHVLTRGSDWDASLDSLQALCPNLKNVSLVVSWFGDDLRAGLCKIEPRVEKANKSTPGFNWSVSGLTRATATPVTEFEGKSAYGGTPNDASVIAAIVDLKARNVAVVFYPFVMMDIPHGNDLVDPWSGGTGQAPYPWRGQITCHPAPGIAGTPDGSTAAIGQVDSFFGSASPGAGEWSYRRFILHYAQLCVQAGGVDTFLIGSELVGLTRVRSASGVYPAVAKLAALASDVKAIVGPNTKVSYAADWTEYGAHVLGGGSELRFPLDNLWASPAIDFVGIDAYWPFSDWRDGYEHADATLGRSIYDPAYLRSRMTAGEGYDWYYADDEARLDQVRTPITDGAYGKPWIYRQKDVKNWWSRLHFERLANTELPTPTAWAASSKPVRIIETGCPAVDRGANAPNVFPDSKSSQSRLPWFSRGFRDDLMQVRTLEAFISHFDPASHGFVEDANPISPVYGGRMIDPAHIHLWAWDARPFPAFPHQGGVWADAAAWSTGHWLNGRIEAQPVDRLVAAMIADAGVVPEEINRAEIDAIADGYVLEQLVSPRAAIEPLASFFGFDAILSSGRIAFESRRGRNTFPIDGDAVVPRRNGDMIEISRLQETEISSRISVNFYDGDIDYRTAAVSSMRSSAGSRRDMVADLAIVTTRANAQVHADIVLQNAWAGRESVEFELPPSSLALEAGDRIALRIDGVDRNFRVTRIADGSTREISAQAVETAIYDHAPRTMDLAVQQPPAIAGPPHVEILDLAIARGVAPPLQYIAAFADPWPARMALWRKAGDASYEFLRHVETSALVGETLSAFLPGIAGRYDRANSLLVRTTRGAFQSVEEPLALGGRNAMAIRGADGRWEIFAFLEAELVAAGTWRLSKFLRGIGGEEHLRNRALAAGAPVVLLDEAVAPLASELSTIGQTIEYRIGPAATDYTDVSYKAFSATVTNVVLRPYAPVRARAHRTVSGLQIEFLRRTRVDGDAWDVLSLPLGEESEAYEIDIFAGSVLKRTLRVGAPLATSTAADELADFGAPQTMLDVAICQMSATAGRGFELRSQLVIS